MSIDERQAGGHGTPLLETIMTAVSLFLLVVCIGLYFLPSFIAGVRDKAHGTGGVVLLNIFLGWTLIGWLVAFIWACSGRTQADVRREDRQHREMLAAITAGKTQLAS
jgi:hypothetical protein